MMTSTQTLVPMLLSRPPVLTDEELRALCLELDAGIRSATAPAAVANATSGQRVRARPASPVKSRGSARGKRRRTAGLIPFLAVVLLMAVFLGSPDLRTGVSDWITGVMTGGLNESSTDDQQTPTKKQCQRDPQREGCPPAKRHK